jgi:hypothetical protein
MRLRKTLPRLFAVLACLAPGAASAVAFDLPDIPTCLELAPGAIATDDRPVTMSLRIVLDGTSAAQAERALATAQPVYEALGIALSVSYERASFTSGEGAALIDEVRRYYGGQRPPGTHAVYVFTAKDLYADDGTGPDHSLVGQADCIGGVAYPEHAFAVGEAIADDRFLTLGSGLAGKTLVHELGHLAGGHHHYANCAESVTEVDAPCTVMINDLYLAAPKFSSLNGLVVRGHAQLLDPAPADGGGALGWLELVVLLAVAAGRSAFRRAGRG